MRHKIPFTDPALHILLKWQAMGRKKKYVFDLVKDELSLNNAEARNTATKCVNQALNVIGQKQELPKIRIVIIRTPCYAPLSTNYTVETNERKILM